MILLVDIQFINFGVDVALTEERVALRKQGLNEKTTASVLLKMFISGTLMPHH